MKNQLNLNELYIPEGNMLSDFSLKLNNPHFDSVEVILRNTEQRLLDIIKQYEKGAIFGCIGWLTSIPILEALRKCEIVQIIVQKEDFLRPDLNSVDTDNWKSKLKYHYDSLQCIFSRFEMREPISDLSVGGDLTVNPIRCVGHSNSEKKSAFPRAHHKFLVFCELNDEQKYLPKALWTGSFNLTFNATQSLENVLYLVDNNGNNGIINAYLKEHHQIFTLSEKLNWENDWSKPQYRIGT